MCTRCSLGGGRPGRIRSITLDSAEVAWSFSCIGTVRGSKTCPLCASMADRCLSVQVWDGEEKIDSNDLYMSVGVILSATEHITAVCATNLFSSPTVSERFKF